MSDWRERAKKSAQRERRERTKRTIKPRRRWSDEPRDDEPTEFDLNIGPYKND